MRADRDGDQDHTTERAPADALVGSPGVLAVAAGARRGSAMPDAPTARDRTADRPADPEGIDGPAGSNRSRTDTVAAPTAPEEVGAAGGLDGPAVERRPLDVKLSGGIGCMALLLPVVAVAGAVLCFAAGLLSAASGCQPNGSALCSTSGTWLTFALPLFIAPIIAAATAVCAIFLRRHRSTWLAAGYLVVFLSIVLGLTSASSGA